MRENVSLDPVEHSVRGHDTHLQNHGKAKKIVEVNSTCWNQK